MLLLLPQLILSVLGVLLIGYGVSLIARTRATARWRRRPRECPECRREWVAGALRCGACGHEAPDTTSGRAGLWRFGGVLFVALGVGSFIGALGVHARVMDDATFGWSDEQGIEVGPVVAAGVALSLLGVWVVVRGVRGQRARGRRRCPKCWYLIDAAVGRKCSECGHEARRERDLFRPRRRWGVAALGVLLVGAGQLGWLEGRVRRGGWVAAVPTEVLILGMPWISNEMTWGWDAAASSGPEPDEDWSLTGRFWEPEGRLWSWHRGFAAWRAAGMVHRGASPRSAMRGLALMEVCAGDDEESEGARITRGQAIAVLEIVLSRLEGTDVVEARECFELLDAATEAGAFGDEEWMAPVLAPHGATIVGVIAEPGHAYRPAAVWMASVMDDHPGLVEALDAARADGEPLAVSALVMLAGRSEAADARVAELIDARQQLREVAWGVAMGRVSGSAVRGAMRRMLESERVEEVSLAAMALGRTADPGGEDEAALLRTMRARPDAAGAVGRWVGRIPGAVERNLDALMELSRSGEAGQRMGAFLAMQSVMPREAGAVSEVRRAVLGRAREMAVSDPDETIRAEARQMLGYFDDAAAEGE